MKQVPFSVYLNKILKHFEFFAYFSGSGEAEQTYLDLWLINHINQKIAFLKIKNLFEFAIIKSWSNFV